MTRQTLQAQDTQTPDVVRPSPEGRMFLPPTDILETPDHWELIADMPGVDSSTLNVTVERDTLTIEGRINAAAPAGHELAYSEYGVGNFRRQFTLSSEVNHEGIDATIKNGVLRMRLAKAARARTHKITVKEG